MESKTDRERLKRLHDILHPHKHPIKRVSDGQKIKQLNRKLDHAQYERNILAKDNEDLRKENDRMKKALADLKDVVEVGELNRYVPMDIVNIILNYSHFKCGNL
jgi:hypothetical protein